MQHNRVSGKHILLVEDDPGVQESIKLLLSIDRHTVIVANDGREALAAFASESFDLVILDYYMAGMRGDELGKAIKQLKPLQPVIMISAYSEKLRDSDKPVDAFLAKPFSIEELRQTIANLLP